MTVTPSEPLDDSGPPATTGFEDLTSGDDADQRPRGRRRLGTIAAVSTCVFIVAMWAFVYIWGAVQRPVDKLSDPSFGHEGERICAVTANELAALPPAHESKTNVARSEVVAESNAALRQMLAQLRDVAPASGKDGEMVGKWLSDYSILVGNREDYAKRLATDPNARFYENQKNPGEQISLPIDSFATANGMHSCVAPEDLS